MAIDPKSRGLESEVELEGTKEVPSKVKKNGSPTKIDGVVAFGPGWMTVEMGDGSIYKRSGGTLAWRNNNAGNIKYGNFAKAQGAIGIGHNNMAVFPTIEAGKKAMRELLFGTNSRYIDLTIKKAISIYAPDYDGNDSDAYCNYVCSHAKLSYTKTLRSLSAEERQRMLDAMQIMESS